MTLHRPTALPAITCLLLALAGCTGLDVLKPQRDVSRFYFLQTGAAGGPAVQTAGGPAVLIGPSSVAKYLDNSQIVAFTGANELTYSDLHRWGEPLEESINRLLIHQISGDLDSYRVGFLRVMGEFKWDYKVGYHVYQLGGQLGQQVSLRISWWIVSKDGQASRYEASFYEQPVAGGMRDHAAYVVAIEALVQAWTEDVARALKELHQG